MTVTDLTGTAGAFNQNPSVESSELQEESSPTPEPCEPTIGNLPIKKAYFGNNKVKKIYLGQTLIWEHIDQPIRGVFITTSSGQSVTFKPGTFIEDVEHKIDWGDGTVEDLTADTKMTHTYATAGEYDFTVKGTSTIGKSAFWQCAGLTSITIPDSVTSIGNNAFFKCTDLTSVSIGSDVTSINASAFKSCSGLASITVDPNNQTYYSDGNCIIQTSDNVLLIGCKTSVIPNNVTSIGQGAFTGCSTLTSISIPASVTSIGNSAFSYCSGLKSIIIPDNVTSIGGNAFQDCSGLTSATIGSGVTRIDGGVFNACTSLTSIIIPNTVTSIGVGAFLGCSSLMSVSIPNSVISLDVRAFGSCTNLTSITIPNSVTSIMAEAFKNCTNLVEIIFEDGREAVPTLDDYDTFDEDVSGRKFYVQANLLDAWKAADYWTAYASDIEALPAA